jgi:hypothetical protein
MDDAQRGDGSETPSGEGQSRPSHVDANTAHAIRATNGSLSCSVLRLHDDELSCVFPFLPLADLVQFIRCNRRFNAVARKERSRGLRLEGSSNIVPVASSSLSHHLTSLLLVRHRRSDAPLTLDMLRQLRDLPRLTALQLTFRRQEDVDPLLQGLAPKTAAAALRAVLPRQLRSFRVATNSMASQWGERHAAVVSSFWAALGDMQQLTELSIEQFSVYLSMRPDLAGLAHLRKLTLGPAGQRGDHVAELKQLSQLRELTLLDDCAERLHLLCQPPHGLQLERLVLPSMTFHEGTMGDVLHLPTLTALYVFRIRPEAWLLLPQLPLLRCLSFYPTALSPEELASLCASLSNCAALEELTLIGVDIVSAVGLRLTVEHARAGWAALLNSVPNLRRLDVYADLTHLLPVLPLHLPLLEELVLSGRCAGDVNPFASVAHPNIHLLEFGLISARHPSDEQLRACIHSERLPKLKRCVRSAVEE